jgi:hypothetical protein
VAISAPENTSNQTESRVSNLRRAKLMMAARRQNRLCWAAAPNISPIASPPRAAVWGSPSHSIDFDERHVPHAP